MADRIVTDVGGREWTCVPTATVAAGGVAPMGKDVMLACSTSSSSSPVSITVGWQWESMSANGLAQIITRVSPVPKR